MGQNIRIYSGRAGSVGTAEALDVLFGAARDRRRGFFGVLLFEQCQVTQDRLKQQHPIHQVLLCLWTQRQVIRAIGIAMENAVVR